MCNSERPVYFAANVAEEGVFPVPPCQIFLGSHTGTHPLIHTFFPSLSTLTFMHSVKNWQKTHGVCGMLWFTGADLYPLPRSHGPERAGRAPTPVHVLPGSASPKAAIPHIPMQGLLLQVQIKTGVLGTN